MKGLCETLLHSDASHVGRRDTGPRIAQGCKVQESTKGPDESKIKALLERTGYTLDVTTGQRKYGGPPPEEVFQGAQPGIGTEVFVGKIPRDLYEDELVPLFEKAGPIWDLRLMMDPLLGQNRGYAFITFCDKDEAAEAVKLWDNYEIRSGKYLGVCISVANNRLFVGSIPKNKTRESILEDRDAAVEAMAEMNGKELGGEETEIVLAQPPDKKRKERPAQRQTTRNPGYDDYYYYPPPRLPPPGRGRGRGGRGGGGYTAYPPDYYSYEDYYEDPYYGYDDVYRENRGGNVGGKRKADVFNQPDSKRRQINQQNWGSQPIAQQPLQQGADYSGNYGYSNDTSYYTGSDARRMWQACKLLRTTKGNLEESCQVTQVYQMS
uniref:Heterogeneous nuclear ribonucleoprotein R n=1 Tax=Hucho hucho TaxID=62062 RepID=A0A4W5NEY3_9TELE